MIHFGIYVLTNASRASTQILILGTQICLHVYVTSKQLSKITVCGQSKAC